MKTELLFRGLRKDGEGFAYGDRVQGLSGKMYIFDYDDIVGNSHIHEVIPESVGQFTGLKDKNGVKVFDGDIVNSGYFKECVVVFWHSGWYFKSDIDSHHSFNTAKHSFEVTGNIHETCKQHQ